MNKPESMDMNNIIEVLIPTHYVTFSDTQGSETKCAIYSKLALGLSVGLSRATPEEALIDAYKQLKEGEKLDASS